MGSFDGLNIPINQEKWGRDFNRNYPYGWFPEARQPGAGEYPLCNPENKAIVELDVYKRQILTPAFICMGLGLALYMFMEIGLLSYAKDYFMVGLNDILGASLCISVVRGGMTLSRLFGERLIKNRVWMSIGTMGLSGLCLLLMAIFRLPVVSLISVSYTHLPAYRDPCWRCPHDRSSK